MRLALAILLLVSSAQICIADSGLKGLREINVWIVGMDKDAEDCGIRREAVETALNLPIRAYTKIKEKDSASGTAAALVLEVLVLKGGSVCATNVRLRLEHYMSVMLPHREVPYFATVMLYQDSHIFMNPIKNASNILNGIEKIAKNFSLAWLKANPN